jgi:hypothetical protein
LRKEDTDLLHGEEGGMIFKYDLPVINLEIKFHNALVPVSETPLTTTEKLFEMLDCDKDTAYESFMIKFS